jgi:hypothetical protein
MSTVTGDDVRPCNEAAGFRREYGSESREHREDGTDHYPPESNPANSRIYAKATLAQSPRGAAASGGSEEPGFVTPGFAQEL